MAACNRVSDLDVIGWPSSRASSWAKLLPRSHGGALLRSIPLTPPGIPAPLTSSTRPTTAMPCRLGTIASDSAPAGLGAIGAGGGSKSGKGENSGAANAKEVTLAKVAVVTTPMSHRAADAETHRQRLHKYLREFIVCFLQLRFFHF